MGEGQRLVGAEESLGGGKKGYLRGDGWVSRWEIGEAKS